MNGTGKTVGKNPLQTIIIDGDITKGCSNLPIEKRIATRFESQFNHFSKNRKAVHQDPWLQSLANCVTGSGYLNSGNLSFSFGKLELIISVLLSCYEDQTRNEVKMPAV